MPTTDYPIIKIGTLFFVAIDKPEHLMDLTDFSDEASEMFGDASIVDLSTKDPFQSIEDQDYIVVQIPFYRNGERLNMGEVINGELQRTLEYLHQKGLRANAVWPGLHVQQSFNFDLQAAG